MHSSTVSYNIFHYCIECKTCVVECIPNVFIDVRMSIICGVPQKIKRREGQKQDKRKEAKMASKKVKDSKQKKTGATMRFPCLMPSHSD